MRWVVSAFLVLALAAPAFAGALEDLHDGERALGSDTAAAVQLLSRAIDSGALEPSDLARAHDRRGHALNSQHDFDGALADFDQAIRLRHDFADAYFGRAEAHFGQRDYARALPDYGVAIRLQPNYARAYLYRGDTYFALRQFAESIPDYDKGIALEPNLPNAYLYRGDAYLNLGRFDKAIADYDRAIALKPDYALAWRQRGRAHAALVEPELALADYDRSIQHDPSAFFTYQDRGYLHFQQGRYDAAIADLSRSLAMSERVPSSWIVRGVAKLYAGRPADAAADLEHAVALRPADAYAALWLHVARARADQSDTEEFAGNADHVDVFNWPYPVVAFYLGRGSERDLESATLLSDNEAVRSARRCDVALFLGEFHRQRKHAGESKRRFREAADICGIQTLQYSAAHAELTGLAAKTP